MHSAYLTHELSSRPSEKQIGQVPEQLPEFQPLLDSLMRYQGVINQTPFQSAGIDLGEDYWVALIEHEMREQARLLVKRSV
ncbi:MAG: hypothetical protein J2P21_09405 [Chloracidobacterium sp.]|nr:hypothetical protein [Chloracidobacterium sp.]